MTSYGRQLTLLAERAPAGPAFVHIGPDGVETTVTWAELERRSNQVARLLEARGVGASEPGTVRIVAVALPNLPEHFFACYGAWKLGATVLPLRWDLPAWERDRLLELAEPVAVIGSWDDAAAGTVHLDDLRASASLDDTALPDRVAAPAQALASSGSTGRPKLIVAPGTGVIEETVSVAPGSELGDDARQLVVSPLYHTNGFACHMWLRGGRPLVVMEKFDAERVVDAIERHRVNYTIMVPTMLQRIARLPGVRDRDFSSIDSVLYGAAPIPEWVVRAWFDLVGPEHFRFSYGGTEGFGICTCDGVQWLEHPGTVGLPQGCEIRILGEDGAEVPVGTVGEIYLRSLAPGPPSEYVGAPPARRTDDGFATFGDMGWVDDDGFLFIADRRVDMIVTGGANVFPAEVEAALSEHPGVRDAVAIGVTDPEWGRRVHAIVEPVEPARPPTDDELRAHCRERLTPYKVPKTFEIWTGDPLRSAAGKVNRSALVAAREPAAE
jgi:bile acid-coenzyme A ligase